MKLRSRVYILCASLCFTGHYKAKSQDKPAAAQELTLQAAWQQAEAHNKEVRLQRKQVEISQEQVKDRQTERLPKVQVGGEYAYLGGLQLFQPRAGLQHPESIPVPPSPHAYTAHVGAEWDVYTGGRINSQVEAQQLGAEVEAQRLNLTQADVRLRVAAAYLELERNGAYKKLTESNIHESEKRLRQIESLYKNGVVLRSDMLRAQLQDSRQKMLLTEIANNLTLANQRLNLLMGTPEDQPNVPTAAILPANTDLAGSYDADVHQAEEHSFEPKIAGLQSRISEARRAETEAAKRPQVGLFAGYGYTYPNRLVFPNVGQIYSLGQAGVRVSYNLSAFYTDRHAEKAAELTVERQQLAEEHVRDDKKEEVKTAFVRYQETLERLRLAEQNIGQAAENYRIVNRTYFNQLALLTDLLDADNQLLQSRFDLVSAQVQAATQYYQLEKALGTL